MDSQTILNVVTICISTILSIGAIILSIWFYRVSNNQNKETAIIQLNIKNAIEKLEQLYERTYTDTFGALKTQLDAMQKHIFASSVGETNNSEPNKIRFYVIGCVTDKTNLSIDELCEEIKGFTRTEITQIVYNIHREGLVEFDGNNIKYLRTDNNQTIEGQSSGK